MYKKKILFLTGTRADFGKLRPLIDAVNSANEFDCHIFVTGMHLLGKYGYTAEEVFKLGYKNVFTFINQLEGEPMELILANTIGGLSRFCHELKPDMMIVHGDRVEALAGAIVGSIKNILVSHVEGGEKSGTIDGLIRHSVSKLSHIHFVSNQDAAKRLKQMGEDPNSIFEIGSPDIDVMLSDSLPDLSTVLNWYDIKFSEYGILLFHSVTTELDSIEEQANQVVQGVLDCNKEFVVLYPNNDSGVDKIFEAYKKFENNKKIRILPSLRFEYFLTLLKNSKCIIGNSSCGLHEAPVFGIQTINIGSRQKSRFSHNSIVDIPAEKAMIKEEILSAWTNSRKDPCFHFGRGKSADSFLRILSDHQIWNVPKQKNFYDISTTC